MFDTRLILKNSIESINKLLRDSLKIEFLEIIDESAKHAGHGAMRYSTEALTHIWIRISAAALTKMSRIEQHRKLYAILQPAIDSGLHAIRFEIL